MAITIETATAEAAFEALKQLPGEELARLRTMLHEPTSDSEESEWHQASRQSMARFFEDKTE